MIENLIGRAQAVSDVATGAIEAIGRAFRIGEISKEQAEALYEPWRALGHSVLNARRALEEQRMAPATPVERKAG